MLLAEALLRNPAAGGAWNFGPAPADCLPVGQVVAQFAQCWQAACGQAAVVELDQATQPHEAGLLLLDASKAQTQLGWQPRWPLPTALRVTAQWFDAWQRGASMRTVTLHQIAKYVADSR